jgi:protein-tyrosine kinase
MAKTYEAMMKAEEEARKKQADGSPPTGDRGLSSASVRGPLTVDRELSSDIDEYYRLKHNILRSCESGKIKSLLFLGPTGGEGVTTVLVEFAMALAAQGEKVLLIDANFQFPSLHERFRLGSENGLAELLLQKCALKDVIKGSGVDNLSVITSGTVDHGPSFSNRGPWTVDRGLPSSGRGLFPFNSLDLHLQKMKEEADWVLFDGPPVTHVDEGIALAAKVDGVVMVVQGEKTRWEVAQAAKQRLEDSGGKILGVVFNKRKFYIPKWLYKTL